MTPIFKNTVISRLYIGPFTKSYAEEHKLLTTSRKCLIGNYFGKEILLITSLLKWYLANGLIVTDIQQVLEYTHQPPALKSLGRLSNACRAAESDPILAETKLLDNSAYGKTITNIEKHKNIDFTDQKGAQKLVNNPLFKKLTPLTDNTYEVVTAKPLLKWDLPIQFGFFVYQYAKLRMLQFYYECINKFLDRTAFQGLQMDTDSFYASLTSESLDEAV